MDPTSAKKDEKNLKNIGGGNPLLPGTVQSKTISQVKSVQS